VVQAPTGRVPDGVAGAAHSGHVGAAMRCVVE